MDEFPCGALEKEESESEWHQFSFSSTSRRGQMHLIILLFFMLISLQVAALKVDDPVEITDNLVEL